MDLTAAADLAEQHPGRWVKADGDYNTHTGNSIRTGDYARFRNGRWEVRGQFCRTTDTGQRRYTIWVKFLGANQ